MVNEEWLEEYFCLYQKSIFNKEVNKMILQLKNEISTTNKNGRKTIILGNGGSAAIASHVSVDFSKNAKIRAVNFNEADLITCLANDYGYEKWMASCIDIYGDSGDIAILISSSGKSKNLINAAETARSKGIKVVTFTGFDPNNPLKDLGEINFWVDSKAYNVIEMTHNIWLVAVVDAIIGKAEYSAN